jgi:hypothetical protein
MESIDLSNDDRPINPGRRQSVGIADSSKVRKLEVYFPDYLQTPASTGPPPLSRISQHAVLTDLIAKQVVAYHEMKRCPADDPELLSMLTLAYHSLKTPVDELAKELHLN